jgi:hypothetical protein
MTTATLITLPASGDKAVQSDYKVKSYTPRQGRDTEQFTASIYRGTKKVAIVENEGSGGAHWFSFVSTEEARLWDEYVAQYDWTEDIETADYSFTLHFDKDAVFDRLANEVVAARWLNKMERTHQKFVIVKDLEDVKKNVFLIAGILDVGDFVWNGSGWDLHQEV